jgi:hypothetical protein
VKSAIEIVWSAPGTLSYALLAAELARREGTAVSGPALRKRVSRGLRMLEEAIRIRRWGLPGRSA